MSIPRALPLLLLIAVACSPVREQSISGPLTLDSAWSEIVPPSPLRVVLDEQAIRLDIERLDDLADSPGSIELADGSVVVLDGEVVDDAGQSYPLAIAAISGKRSVYLYRAGDYPPGPDYPTDRKIVKVRLRSGAPLQVEEVRWICSKAK